MLWRGDTTTKLTRYCSRYYPYTSHSLQLVDVVLYKLLVTVYSTELDKLLHHSQELLRVQKGGFVRLFRAGFTFTFTSNKISSNFAATGVHPRDPNVIPKRFTASSPRYNKDTEVGEQGDSRTWKQPASFFDAVVIDIWKIRPKRLKQALHSLQVRNELLHRENDDLRAETPTKKRVIDQSKILDL